MNNVAGINYNIKMSHKNPIKKEQSMIFASLKEMFGRSNNKKFKRLKFVGKRERLSSNWEESAYNIFLGDTFFKVYTMKTSTKRVWIAISIVSSRAFVLQMD